MLKFDVVITTYQRPDSVCNLVSKINKCELVPAVIVIVDSSDEANTRVKQLPGVNYIQSSHKNQPYQRYLGYLASCNEITIFMDDDVDIINNRIFNIILERYMDPIVIGSNVKYIQEGVLTVQKEFSGQWRLNKHNHLVKLFWWITGVPAVGCGKIWLAGLKGNDDTNIYTESFGGPGSLSFRREIIPSLFDDLLFSVFERKMGMGEDKYISMGALRYGRLGFNNIPCLSHPANDSTYFDNIKSFVRKEIYSRLLLSRRYVQVNHLWIGWAYLHFYWYAIWRIVITLLYFIFHPNEKNRQQLIGKILGVLDTFTKPLSANFLCPGINWKHELSQDLKRNIPQLFTIL